MTHTSAWIKRTHDKSTSRSARLVRSAIETKEASIDEDGSGSFDEWDDAVCMPLQDLERLTNVDGDGYTYGNATRRLPKRIVLVRHGESTGNLDESEYTRTPDSQIPLTKNGHVQATQTGAMLRNLFDANDDEDYKCFFYISPYRRSKQTALGIAQAFEKRHISGVREEPQLREQDFGNFQDLQQKKAEKDVRMANVNNDNPMEYEFPEIEEYFVYSPKSTYPSQMPSAMTGGNKGIKMTRDSVAYCTSGLVDRNKGSTLSYLHKAIKAVNQLRMIEDSLVIYRLSRAPERRIFYIDVGNLPKVKAEQYLRDVMMRYRNKLVYNADTGEIKDDKKYMSMLEDFWLPRREGGRGTEITTLPGGQNLGELADIEYFQKNLYRALGVPESRIAADGGFNLGRSSEILRDELKFAKFVGRLRKRFAQMFNDMLKTQLILKNIVSVEDWDRISDHIQYDFLYDNQFAELKETEMLNERLGVLASIEPYIGKYYSQKWVRTKVLRQTDGEMIEMDEQIEQEIKDGIIPDPSAMDPITGEPLPQEGEQGMMGDVPMEPEINGGMTEVDGKTAEI